LLQVKILIETDIQPNPNTFGPMVISWYMDYCF